MGRTLKELGSLPLSLRVAWVTCVGTVLVTILGSLALPGDVDKAIFPFAFGLIGLAALLQGLILVTDYHGSLSSVAKRSTIGNGSLLRVFLRVYGVLSMVIGAIFVAVSVFVLAFVRPL
ncbi:hypothetical protein [Arthrobacter sp. B2a2-09]|uniref:hypothetical protein n=1 Tax=Arthrobacter sp. B2a2-09 TaxID=2952822 RepID=UPI0022CD3181|nr:hypothetical protein [Arthrobacter sp. B2a2-09]MCZ9884090.1 hypothetical protein [Arthrobacter sp. B2a2-09]